MSKLMSKESFQKWIENIEERLALHLFYNEKDSALHIEIKERNGNGWTVFLEGEEVQSYYGEGAQDNANRLAMSIAEQKSLPVFIPDKEKS